MQLSIYMMKITEETKTIIVGFMQIGYGAKRIKCELKNRNIYHSLSGIQHVVKKWQTLRTIGRKKGSGRRISEERKHATNTIKRLLNPPDDSTPLSLRRAGRITNLSHSTVRRVAKKELHLNVYKKKKVQKLTVVDKAARVERCRFLLECITERKLGKAMFVDEKYFTLNAPFNSQNCRVWSTAGRKNRVPKESLLFPTVQYDEKVMVFAGVTLNGKSRLTFVENNNTVDSIYYTDQLLPRLFVDCHTQIGANFILVQDGAPCHASYHTQSFLEARAPHFIRKNRWPPHSPDLNPMDYAVWMALEEKVYKHRITTLEQLKDAITAAWRGLSLRFVRSCVRQFRQRLQLVIDNDGGHIEHLFL